MSRPTIRHQKRVKGGRQPVGSAFIRELEAEVERQCRLFRVSRSFLIATAVADHLGVKAQERYDEMERPRWRLRSVK